KLYQRIEQRVDDMIRQGLERETRALLVGGVNPKANALQSVGYREMIQYIRGELAFAEMVDKIKQHTRNFAKRQLTWFRRDARIRWVEVHSEEELDRASHQMLEIITQLQQQTLER
ncbi:MAG: tRNA (adenosine(37)-N6)-dimethylallyltransferase MiaA, partial [Calditrichaeota bacterium]